MSSNVNIKGVQVALNVMRSQLRAEKVVIKRAAKYQEGRKSPEPGYDPDTLDLVVDRIKNRLAYLQTSIDTVRALEEKYREDRWEDPDRQRWTAIADTLGSSFNVAICITWID